MKITAVNELCGNSISIISYLMPDRVFILLHF